METKIIGVDKKIIFESEDETITNIFIQVSESMSLISYQIKFSIKPKGQEMDAWYLITSIDPVQVFGGLAGTFLNTHNAIMIPEYEVINFVVSRTSKDFYDMAANCKIVRTNKDFYN